MSSRTAARGTAVPARRRRRLVHPTLLRLVREELDLYPFHDERDLYRAYKITKRSPRNPVLGPAAQIYFGLVNSGWFVELLAPITQELIADTSLHNGGLHESRRGGKFAVHRDFERATSSVYLFLARSDRLRLWARQLTPPIVWDALKRSLH